MYKEKIEKARQEAVRYEKIVTGIKDAELHALRNRYTLEIYEQTNQLFNYPTRLILALAAYDAASNEVVRSQALQEIKAVCEYFPAMRSAFVSVYSETRFMQNPGGYIEDMNHHNHLAARTQNSDWWFLYEQPMVVKVEEWINKK